MEDSEVPLEEIKAEIRDSVDRLKALVAESEGFIRQHRQSPLQADDN